MIGLSFRVPTGGLPLLELLPVAYPDLKEEVYPELLIHQRIRVDGVVETDGEVAPKAGSMVEILGDDDDLLPLSKAAPDPVARGDGWFALPKPRGPIGASLGLPADILEAWAADLGAPGKRLDPLFDLDPDVEGLWLLAESRDAAPALVQRLKEEGLTLFVEAIIPALPAGPFALRDGALNAQIRGMKTRGELALVDIALTGGRILDLRRALADIGAAVLGDLRFGGVATQGGLRLRVVGLECGLFEGLISLPEGESLWPNQRNPFPQKSGERPPTFPVSDSTLAALEKGHRWCLPDAEIGDLGAYRPGTLVRLEGRGGGRGPAAILEGPGVIAARVWGRKAHMEDLKARFGKALGRRQDLLKDPMTTALRLIHGEGDGFPGLEVDLLGSVIRATVVGRAAEGFLGDVEGFLMERFPALTHLRLYHVRGIKGTEAQLIHRGPEGPRPGEMVTILERGLRFRVDPWGGLATGYFADQRENRRRVEVLAKPRSRWLNLFSHTGAFSAALLRAGAEVTSVDLSKSYLEWLEENLALNGLGEGHTAVKRDVRAFLEESEGGFDGIVCDPPAAAAAGRRFWSVKKAYPQLLALAVAKLTPGGVLLACRNHRHRKPPLSELVAKAAAQAGTEIRSLGDSGPGPDFPAMRGFPEGDPFEASLIRKTAGRYHPLGTTGSKTGRRASR